MKQKTFRILKTILYLLFTSTSLIIIYYTLLLSPFDLNHVARFGELAIDPVRVEIAMLVWGYNAIKNIIISFVVRRFNRYFFVLSLSLGVACLVNCLGAYFFSWRGGWL